MPGPNYRYDLRSNAVDSKRDREVKQKWGPEALKGKRFGREPRNPASNKWRPGTDRVQYYDRPLRYNQRERTRQARERAQYQKADPLAEPEDDLPHDDEDTSHWDDEHTPETTPEADDEVMYSFDAPRGPTLGEEVLSEAMHKAVARFEDGKTVKLVNDEYEVIDSSEPDLGPCDDSDSVVEDGFELI